MNNSPTNTSQEMKDPLVASMFLAKGLETGDSEAAILAQEAQGQAQMLVSDVLPIDGTQKVRDGHYVDGARVEDKLTRRQKYEALGFVFGDVVEGDEMFINVELPNGWSRKGSAHAMWSYILDERGLPRIAIFYKAAFYDRSAHCNFNSIPNTYAGSIEYGEPEDSDFIDVQTEWVPKLTKEEIQQCIDRLEEDANEDHQSWHSEKDVGRRQKARKGADFLIEHLKTLA